MKNYGLTVTDEDIYRYICGDIVVGHMYHSPLREEYNASFGLYEKNGVIRWRDFGIFDQGGNLAINLLMKHRDVSFNEAIQIANKEVKHQQLFEGTCKLKRAKTTLKLPYLKYRDIWKDYELDYWHNKHHIGVDALKANNIWPLESLSWISDDYNVSNSNATIRSVPGDPAFVYIFATGDANNPLSFKIYRPLTAKARDKFRQWNVSNIIEGWSNLVNQYNDRGQEPFPILLNVASTKDRMVVQEAGFFAMNPSSETTWRAFDENKNIIDTMAHKVVTLYDADKPGFTSSERLKEKFEWEFIDMRNQLGAWKDFSDWVCTDKGNNSIKDLRELIIKLL